MLCPAALLRGGDALARGFAQNAFLAGLCRTGGRRIRRCRGIDSPDSQLPSHMVDLSLNLIALPLKMPQRILENRSILIYFASRHDFSLAHYIMENYRISQVIIHAIGNTASDSR